MRGEYPSGVAGVKLSLEAIAQHIREGANDKDVQGVAMDALLAAGVDGRTHGTSARAKMDVLLAYVRANTVYTQDPPGTELVKSAAAMLCLRPGLCIRGGDCDDMCILLGSMLLSVGVPVMVVKQRWGLTDQEHVLIEAQDDSGRWIPLDPSTNVPSGSKTPSSDEFRLDPSNPSMIGLTGAPEAQFVSIGATPGFPIRAMGTVRMRGLSPRTVGVVSTPTATAPTSPTNPYGQALIDLQNMVQTPIGIADSYLGNKDYASALTAYQAAGQVGATVVGPEIDLVGAPAYTQPLTQQAWITNKTLASISPANQANATLAQSFAKQMLATYVAAIQAGQTAFNGGNPGSVPTPSWSATEVIPWMLGTGLALGLGVAYMDARKSRQRPIPLRRRKRRR